MQASAALRRRLVWTGARTGSDLRVCPIARRGRAPAHLTLTPMTTSTSRASTPRTTLSASVPLAPRTARSRSPTERTALPAAAVIRSPRERPAVSATLPDFTRTTSRPGSSASPTARRIFLATAAPATATPRRRCSPSPGSKNASQAVRVSPSEPAAPSGSPVGEPRRALVVAGTGALHQLAAAVGEGDGDAAPILGVRLAGDHPRTLEPAEADRQGPGGAAQRADQLALVEGVVLGALERVEHEEARTGEPVLGQRLLQLGLHVGGDADDGVGQLPLGSDGIRHDCFAPIA